MNKFQLLVRSSWHDGLISTCLRQQADSSLRNVVVEFSSPNIAKPFHVGHLRSTITGNFVANLLEAAKHNVVRINYLGDWGTQFGLLAAAYERVRHDPTAASLLNNHDSSTPISGKLAEYFKLYVLANKLAKSDSSFRAKALDTFAQMEAGDVDALAFWKSVRDASIDEYVKFYNSFNVNFHHFDGESMYADAAKKLCQTHAHLLTTTNDGRIGLDVDLGKPRFLTLMKSDGSTLYLSRDLAAIIDRFERFHFDKAFYVVAVDQREHFLAMKACLRVLQLDDLADRLVHVPFGHILGMSSREGNAVFVDELIEQGCTRTTSYIERSPTKKISPEEYKDTAFQLALSALFISDMMERRTHPIDFTWERALRVRGDTGVYLQFAHAKLCSLRRNSSLAVDFDDTSLVCTLLADAHFSEPEAVALIEQLGNLEPMVTRCYTELEPSVLVRYLFKLARLSGSAHKRLRVREEADEERARARLALFECARRVMADGLRLLGLRPLERI